MADPLTHLCSALLPKAVTGGRHPGAFALGAVLPDFASRLPGLVLEQIEARAGLDVPDAAYFPFAVPHLPLGAALGAALVATVFHPSERREAFAWLVAGVALHFALDVTQTHADRGYALLYPLSRARFELGWIGSEATVDLAPWLAAATLVAWAARLAARHRR